MTHKPGESLEQSSTRLLQQSAIEQDQAKYLNEVSAVLREQSQALRDRSHNLRSRMAALAAGLADRPGLTACDNLADAAR
jgi:hypothetical protein